VQKANRQLTLCAPDEVGAQAQFNPLQALAELLLVFGPRAAFRAPGSLSLQMCHSCCLKVNHGFGKCKPVMCTAEATRTSTAEETRSKPDVQTSYFHVPVMLKEVTTGLITDTAGTYVDATVGGGGHAAGFLEVLSPNGGRLICLDRDPDALQVASQRLRPYITAGSTTLVQSNFAMLAEAMTLLPSSWVNLISESKFLEGVLDGIFLDLGPSSYQMDEASRGFSPEHEGPLDMRMDQEGIESRTAWNVLNEMSKESLTGILFDHYFPEEAAADFARIARGRKHVDSIVYQIFRHRPISTTLALRDILEKDFGSAEVNIIFDALRREVNQDFSAIEAVLNCAARLVRAGGRLVVISYGARQDWEVNKHLTYSGEWQLVTEEPQRPSDEEMEANSRAQFAVLRVFRRTSNPFNPLWSDKQRYVESKPAKNLV